MSAHLLTYSPLSIASQESFADWITRTENECWISRLPILTHRAKHCASRLHEPSDNFQSQAEQWLLKHFAPAAAIVTDQGDILYISGRTGRFLEPAAGKANWNMFVMARESLRYELASAFQKARGQKGPVVVRCLYQASETESSLVELNIQVIDQAGLLRFWLLVFNELTNPIAYPKDSQIRPINRLTSS